MTQRLVRPPTPKRSWWIFAALLGIPEWVEGRRRQILRWPDISKEEKLKKNIAILILLVGITAFVSHPRRVSAQVVPFDTGQISVAATVTNVVGPNNSRTGLLITNPGTVAVYLGNVSVTTATGAYLPGGASINFPTQGPVYGISSGAAQTVTFLETYGAR